jgi:signal transduction histidine kinase
MIRIFIILLLVSMVGCGVCFVRLRRSEKARRASQALARSLLETHERERKRIAEELHAGLGQNLLVMKNRAELGLRDAVNHSVARHQFEEISKVCSVAIEEARRTAHDLGPRHLEQLGLTEALDAMVDRVAASTHIQFERKLESIDDLFAKDASVNIYRIVQEALNNVLKHGQATKTSVRICRDLKHVQVSVQDNGVGFDRARVNGHRRDCGLGLAVIAERVRIIGGKLEVSTGPGQGTLLAVTIPTSAGKS